MTLNKRNILLKKIIFSLCYLYQEGGGSKDDNVTYDMKKDVGGGVQKYRKVH